MTLHTAGWRGLSGRAIAVFAIAAAIALAATWSMGGGPRVGGASSGVNVAGYYIPIDPFGYLYISDVSQTAGGVTGPGTTVSVFNEATNALVTQVGVGRAPKGIDVLFGDPEGDEGPNVFVANSLDNTMSVIADSSTPATDKVTNTVSVGRSPWGLAVLRTDPEAVAVANNGDSTVSVVGLEGKLVAVPVTLPTFGGKAAAPQGIAIDQAAREAYTANAGNGTVTAIDLQHDTVLANIFVGGTPVWDATDASGHLFVVSQNGTGNGTLTAISTLTNTVIATTATGPVPTGVAWNPVNGKIGVTNYGNNTATFYTFSAPTFTQTGLVSLPPGPQGVAFTNDGNNAYITSTQTGTITEVSNGQTSTFQDSTPPTVTISSQSGYYKPGNSINGTVTDDASGVGQVQYGITPAGAATPPASPVNDTFTCSNSSNLSCTWSAPLPASDGAYKVWVRASDRNSPSPNTSGWVTLDNILVDGVAPRSQITSPPDGSILVAGSTVVSGTASDDFSGVASVTVIFTPTSIGSATTARATLNGCGQRVTVTCTWSVVTPSTLTPGTYQVQSQATDFAGNVETPSPGRTFNIGL